MGAPARTPLEILEAAAARLESDHGLLNVRVWLQDAQAAEALLATVQQMPGRSYNGLKSSVVAEMLRAARPSPMLLDRIGDDPRFEPPVPAGWFVGVPLTAEGRALGYLECYGASDVPVSFETAAELQRAAAEIARALDQEQRGTEQSAQKAAPGSRGRILVTDDDGEIRGLVRALLERNGYEVVQASNGLEGYETAKKMPLDLIVMDLMMPIMDGLEATKRLKADAATASIPIVMLTSQSRIDDKVMGLEAGAQDFITKPFHTKELIARINQHMRWRALISGAAAQAEPPRSSEVADEPQERDAAPSAATLTGSEDYWLRAMEASQLGRFHDAMTWFIREAEHCEQERRFPRAAIAYRSASVAAGQLKEHDLSNKYLRLAGKMNLCWAESDTDPARVKEGYVNAARCFLMAGNLKLAKKGIDFAHSIDAVLADDRPSSLS